MATVYEQVKQAVLHKQIVTATHHGYLREMCPHVIGTKNGRQHALFYQFAGGSKRGVEPDGSPQNWRCIFLDELSGVNVKAGSWHSASDYGPDQTCVHTIDVHVPFPTQPPGPG